MTNRAGDAAHPPQEEGADAADVTLTLDQDDGAGADNTVEMISNHRAVRVRSNTAELDTVAAEAARLWPLTADPAPADPAGAGFGFAGGAALHAERLAEDLDGRS